MKDQNKIRDDLIPHSKPTLGAEESRAVSEVIESGCIAEGDTVAKFESAFAWSNRAKKR